MRNCETAWEHYSEANRLQYHKREFEKANFHYRRAIALKPDFVQAVNQYAQNLRLNLKDYNSAVEQYSKLIAIDPSFEYAYYRRGVCKGYLKDYKGQYEDFTLSMQFSYAENYHFTSRALVSRKAGNYDDVISDCLISLFLGEPKPTLFKLINEGLCKVGFN